jgi:O-antigen ligase
VPLKTNEAARHLAVNLYLLFIAPILAAVFIGILINPGVALYYFVLDSWLVGKITDLGEILPFFSVNKILLMFSAVSLLLHMALGACKVDLQLLFSRTALFVYAFIAYLLWSSLYLMGRNEPILLNNLAFFVLILAIMGYKTLSRLKWVVTIIIAASAGIMLNTVGQRLIDVGSLLADVSKGGRIQPGFHILVTIPFLIAVLKTNTSSKVRGFTKILLVAAILFIFAQLSRTLVASLLILACFYVIRGYIKVIWAMLLVPIVVCVLVIGMMTDYGQTLLRLPTEKKTQLNEQEMQAFTSGRSALYWIAWKMFLRYPLAGEGYDSFRHPKESTLVVPAADLGERSALHSTWLQMLSETGIIGTMLYFGLYLSAYLDFKRTRHTQEDIIRYYSEAVLAGMLLFFLGGIFDNFGFNYRIFFLFLALSSVLASISRISPAPAITEGHIIRHSDLLPQPLIIHGVASR